MIAEGVLVILGSIGIIAYALIRRRTTKPPGGDNLTDRFSQVSASVGAPSPRPPIRESLENRLWYSHLVTVSKQHSIPLNVLEAQLWTESGGRETVVSSAGAIGLFQIKPIVLDDYQRVEGITLDEQDLFDPIVNIDVGAFYLAWLRDNFADGNLETALTMYANGIGNVRRGVLPHASYAQTVLERAGVT